MDKIFINDMVFYGYHGLYPEENRLGQQFIVSLTIELDLKQAGQSDKMEESIHYGEIFNITRDIVEGEAKNLIESVAESVAEELLQKFNKIHAITVQVKKPGAPIPGYFKNVAVEIYRENTK